MSLSHTDSFSSASEVATPPSPSTPSTPPSHDFSFDVPLKSVGVTLAAKKVAEDKTPAFVKELIENAPLPKKLSWGHLPPLAFATFTTASASFLYVLGGDTLGLKYVIGGVGVNVPQNGLMGFGTWDFFVYSYKNFKDVWGLCLTATVLGVTSTVPTTLATWDLSKGGWWGGVQTGLTFIGTLPSNIYGIFDAVRRPFNAKKDNPRVRTFLMEQYRASLPAESADILESERSRAGEIAGKGMGAVIGLALAVSLIGYVCNTKSFLAQDMDEDAAWASSILTNAPIALIAVLIFGFDLAKEIVNLFADMFNHVTGNKKIVLTDRDKAFAALYLVLAGGFSYMAYYSGATSQALFDGDCPSFGPLNGVLRHDAIDGVEMFNEVFMLKGCYELVEYFKKAYARDIHSREIYQVKAVEKFIKTGPVKDLEGIAEVHFRDRAAQWLKPVVKQNENSCFALFRRLKPAALANNTQQDEPSYHLMP